jgi:hypothetical protein
MAWSLKITLCVNHANPAAPAGDLATDATGFVAQAGSFPVASRRPKDFQI